MELHGTAADLTADSRNLAIRQLRRPPGADSSPLMARVAGAAPPLLVAQRTPERAGDFRVPLSALSALPHGALGEQVDPDGADSVSGATTTTSSSAFTLSSTGSCSASSTWSVSAGSEPPHDELAMRALEEAFAPQTISL